MNKEALKRIRKNLDKLKEFGSPLYVYDYETLKTRCEEMKNFQEKLTGAIENYTEDTDFGGVYMHYSTKANSNPAILDVVREAELNVDCMSPTELELDKLAGFADFNMLYVCNNIDEEEMKLVHSENLEICLDSISQVDTWGKLFPNTEIMVRINPGVIGVGHSDKVITSGKATKFGISEENLDELFRVAEKHNLKIAGTHQHLGSLFLNDKIDEYIAGVEAGLKIIKKHFKDLVTIDLGGGFGVPYKPGEKRLDLDLVADRLIDVLTPFLEDYKSIEMIYFEPGRYIPCEAGFLLGNVTATKNENGINWIGTNLGMNQLVRPSMYDSYHEISILNDQVFNITANICGNVCESGDIMGKDRTVKVPTVGDAIVVHNAGAYGYSMASNYTGRLRPAEVMLYPDGNIELIRKRETIDDLTRNIVYKQKVKK